MRGVALDREAVVDATFWKEIEQVLQSYVGRPTPLMHAENLSKKLGGARLGNEIQSFTLGDISKFNLSDVVNPLY